jgi:hypothetical protein
MESAARQMSKAPKLREIPELPEELRQAALDGHLILFVGAGVSMLVGLPSWRELASLALEDIRRAGGLDYSTLEQLRALDPRKQLSIVQLIEHENGTPVNLGRHLEAKSSACQIYEYLNKIGCACVTTNYDELLAPTYVPVSDGSTTAPPVTRVSKKEDFHAGRLNSPGTVLHLHGLCSDPPSMIVSTKDYLEHYDAPVVQNLLGELFKKKTVLFLGYGLEEAEILEHILRRGGVGATDKLRRRFSVQGFFRSERPLYESLYDYYLKSFGVHLIGFVRDHKNHEQLVSIVKEWSEQLKVRPPALAEDLDYIDEVLGGT